MLVAMREVWEETGDRARPVSARSFSIESLCVAPHIKRGAYVSAHIHMNVTFLMEADPNSPPRVKPDENSAVMWMPFEKIDQYCSEVGMLEIYRKLMWRARQIP